MSPDVIAEAMWGDALPRTWLKVVQGSIVRLRKLLGAGAVLSVNGGYRLDLAPGDLDLDVFQTRVESARRLQAIGGAGQPVHDAARWRQAAAADDPVGRRITALRCGNVEL